MPLSGTPTANPVLAQTAREFFQEEGVFVGRAIAPVFNSGVPSGEYYVFDGENVGNWPVLETRAPGTAYPKITMQLSSATFSTKDRGVVCPVDDVERAKYAVAFDADIAAIRRNVMIIRYNEDKRIKTLVDAVATASSPGTKWDNASGTPREDVETAKNAIYDKTGLEPNTIVMSRAVRDAIKNNADFIDRFKYTANPNGVTLMDIAAYLQVPRVLVAGALENTANDGQAMSLSALWNDDVFLCHANPAQDLSAPNWARTFAFDGGGGQETVDSWRDEETKSDNHRIFAHTQETQVGADLGYRFDDVLT